MGQPLVLWVFAVDVTRGLRRRAVLLGGWVESLIASLTFGSGDSH